MPNNASLPDITGNCDSLVIPYPLATDNCAGTITATTASPLAYTVSGTYTITWDYSDTNGNISHQQQTVLVSQQPLPIAASEITLCFNPQLTLADIPITGQDITWYDAQLDGTELAVTTALSSGTTYYASQTIGSCESQRKPVTITIQNTPKPEGEGQQNFCKNLSATVADFIVNGSDIKFYGQQIGGTVLPLATVLTDGSIYWASQTIEGCESIQRLELTANIIDELPASDYEANVCDNFNDGTEIIDLTLYSDFLIPDSINYSFEYYTSAGTAQDKDSSGAIADYGHYDLRQQNNSVYVRVEYNSLCYKVVLLKINLIPSPAITIKDSYSLCEDGKVSITADPGYTYKWSTGSTAQTIVITQPGNYQVTIYKDNSGIVCSSTKEFSVELSYKPRISHIEINDWTDRDNAITIVTGASGNYEYSIDGEHYQDSNIFENLAAGRYTVYVRDRNGCGTVKTEILLLTYPKFFTPNGDGINDFWSVKLSFWEPGMSIHIFDRYGKVITSLSYNDKGWDGMYNGQPLPATDYWFVVKRADGTEHRGHFTLER